MEANFGEVLVPTEEVVEMKNGVKRKSERKFFPGYVLVHMEMNDATLGIWSRIVPKVMGFIGGKADKPAPITDREADAILGRIAVRMPMRRVRRRCLSRAKWFVSPMVPSRTLMAWWKK
jgi:transcriptional antiterminator NusG